MSENTSTSEPFTRTWWLDMYGESIEKQCLYYLKRNNINKKYLRYLELRNWIKDRIANDNVKSLGE